MGVWERRRLRTRLAGLASLLPLLSTGAARAEPLDVRGFGVFMGYSWGAEQGFEWGFESISTHHFEPMPKCSSKPRAGFGPVLRVAMAGASRLAFTAGMHLGGESTRSVLAFDGELGGTLAFGKKGLQGGVHTGLLFETLVFNAYARQAWLMSAYSMGAGIRYAPTFGEPGNCAEGRPFRDGDGRAQAAAIWAISEGSGCDAVRAPEARRWAKRAADEHASVPAFLQLAHELLSLDAPCDLIERALDAAEEEIGHAWAATGLASRFATRPLFTTAPSFSPRAPLERPLALARLARESWLDGCLNEGFAAQIALAEAGETRDPEEAAVSAVIAREEAGHAALAFDILRWLRGEAPELAWSRLLGATQDHAGRTPSDARLSPTTLRELAHDHSQRARSRFSALLDGA
jgi:hypothetical protein